MKILELSTEGTVQRHFIAPLAAHLTRQGHTVIQADGARFSIRRSISLWDGVAVLRLLWYLRWQPIDILHVHTAKAGAVGRLAAWLAGTRRVVYTAHDFPFHNRLPMWKRRLYAWLERQLATLCQAITVDSPAVKNHGLMLGIAPAHKIVVIPVGVDTTKFNPHAYGAQMLPGVWIGTVARLVPEKGLETLLQALHDLIEKGFPVRGLIVGEGRLRQALEARAAALGLSTAVVFVGYQEDVRPWLGAMDIFALPTQREGLSVAVLEAMSMERPVVVSDLPAFHDVVLPEQTGLVAGDWVAQLTRLVTDPELRRRLGTAARVHVREFYEQAGSCRAYERVIVGREWLRDDVNHTLGMDVELSRFL